MKSEDKSETQETQNKQEKSISENKKETSDAQLLLQSKEKIQKVEGSHMNFAEASKREKDDIEKIINFIDNNRLCSLDYIKKKILII